MKNIFSILLINIKCLEETEKIVNNDNYIENDIKSYFKKLIDSKNLLIENQQENLKITECIAAKKI